jgi:hypothetical protein
MQGYRQYDSTVTVNNELLRMWMEDVLTCFKVLSHMLCRCTITVVSTRNLVYPRNVTVFTDFVRRILMVKVTA